MNCRRRRACDCCGVRVVACEPDKYAYDDLDDLDGYNYGEELNPLVRRGSTKNTIDAPVRLSPDKQQRRHLSPGARGAPGHSGAPLSTQRRSPGDSFGGRFVQTYRRLPYLASVAVISLQWCSSPAPCFAGPDLPADGRAARLRVRRHGGGSILALRRRGGRVKDGARAHRRRRALQARARCCLARPQPSRPARRGRGAERRH